MDVELLGRVEPARVRELLAGAAAVLMPSRYHEFSPYSALEAMAQGVPVVATAMGGLPDLLGPGRCVPHGRHGRLRRPPGGALGRSRARARWRAPSCWSAPGRATPRGAYMDALLDLYARL